MVDIPDSDCLASEDTATGMGIVAMKYAYDRENLLRVLPLFKKALQQMPHDKAACLLAKISIYLKEYVTRDVLKELDMAFVSIGQKYGFVSGNSRESNRGSPDSNRRTSEEAPRAGIKSNAFIRTAPDGELFLVYTITGRCEPAHCH